MAARSDTGRRSPHPTVAAAPRARGVARCGAPGVTESPAAGWRSLGTGGVLPPAGRPARRAFRRIGGRRTGRPGTACRRRNGPADPLGIESPGTAAAPGSGRPAAPGRPQRRAARPDPARGCPAGPAGASPRRTAAVRTGGVRRMGAGGGVPRPGGGPVAAPACSTTVPVAPAGTGAMALPGMDPLRTVFGGPAGRTPAPPGRTTTAAAAGDGRRWRGRPPVRSGGPRTGRPTTAPAGRRPGRSAGSRRPTPRLPRLLGTRRRPGGARPGGGPGRPGSAGPAEAPIPR